jgi:hypothetical protein
MKMAPLSLYLGQGLLVGNASAQIGFFFTTIIKMAPLSLYLGEGHLVGSASAQIL